MCPTFGVQFNWGGFFMGGSNAWLNHLQIVVAGKAHQKVPGHDIGVPNVHVNNDAFLSVQTIGHAPWRVAEVVARNSASWADAAHHPRQALRPIAGAEGLSGLGHAQDDDFFGIVALHHFILGRSHFKLLTAHCP